ncbi:putative mitochondrial protein kinase [Leptomonas pyrrhocoris]|eukprot:XP_015665135.1 putative mitochondrial protein kinase [Leptomonas pyrrhocoris]
MVGDIDSYRFLRTEQLTSPGGVCAMEKYALGPLIGEGQFGSVRAATVKSTGQAVAVKLLHVPRVAEGIPHPVARELLVASRVSSPFLVNTIEVLPYGSHMVLVMERCSGDLAAVLRRCTLTRPFPLPLAQSYLQMLLSALHTLHSDGVLHRDVKPANCCIACDGRLKLGDFGLSRPRSDDMSHEVVSRWYRAPELLFGRRRYGGEVDLWAAGCIFAELLRGYGQPFFTGDGDISQLARIFDVLGTPVGATGDIYRKLPDWEKVCFEEKRGSGLRALLPLAPADALDLLTALLDLDPGARPTAAEALRHPFFALPPESLRRC